MKYVTASIYLSDPIIRTTLVHLAIRNIPHSWCVQTPKLWIQATDLKIMFAHPEESQVPAPTTNLQSNFKAPGHFEEVKKEGISLKLDSVPPRFPRRQHIPCLHRHFSYFWASSGQLTKQLLHFPCNLLLLSFQGSCSTRGNSCQWHRHI